SDDDLAATHALADVVVGFTDEAELHAGESKCAEALACGAGEVDFDLTVAKSLVAVEEGNLPRQTSADGAVGILDLRGERFVPAAVHDHIVGILNQNVVDVRVKLNVVVASADAAVSLFALGI